ncbi:MAG: GNAT family N-acetyltransferase [Erysipelotrichaceae bacterium]|nr:GNAT family N-acetyltransferase [Erysipelotrichaceae bacterium]
MRLLFELDNRDYQQCTRTYRRDSARSIIISRGRIAMVHSRKYDYYKFPGGGIRNNEDPVDAMIRESREEAGLIIMPETVREYGCVHRIQQSDSDEDECFIQDNYYYLAEAQDKPVAQDLDDYEAGEGYTLEFVEPDMAIEKDYAVSGTPYNKLMFIREARVLELLKEEGYFEDLEIARMSKTCRIRKLREVDADEVLSLCKGNPLYYQYCPPQPSRQSIISDMKALPPGKDAADKHYLGYYDDERLIAVTDLITRYPDDQSVFIGFFMTDAAVQHTGAGSRIIEELCAYFRDRAFRRVRLGWVSGNGQAESFWKKNGFRETGETIKTDEYVITIAEKQLQALY